MTWTELAEKIAQMPADQKKRDVLLIEDYDGPNRRAVVLGVVQAHEDVYCGFGIGCDRILMEGDLFLQEEKESLSTSMPTRLAQFFKNRRLQQKLSLGQLSQVIGYRDTGKGAGRIHRFEETGVVHPVLLAKLVVVFGIDNSKIESLIQEDRREFIRKWVVWAKEAIDPYLVVRMIPAFYVTEVVPPEAATTLDDAEIFAAKRARHWQKRCCLVWSRRHSVWFDEQGEVYDRTEALAGLPNMPYMRLGRSNKSFLVRSLSNPDFIQAVQWPEPPGPSGKEKE